MILLNYSYFVFKVLEDCPRDLKFWYRHISKGGWPFSTADNGWPTSDCTAEGLKVTTELTQNNCYTDTFIVYFSCAGCYIII